MLTSNGSSKSSARRRQKIGSRGPKELPRLVYANRRGEILDHPDYAMAVRDGAGLRAPKRSELVPLPEGSDLFLLPGRQAVGFPIGQGREVAAEILEEEGAVAAFLAPAWVRYALPAAATAPGDQPLLPLYAYAAVGFADDRFWVPAERIDADIRQDLDRFDLEEIEASVRARLLTAPEDRLLQHVADCALVRCCPAARNFFLGRWEAPLPTASGCNSACIGCISEQPEDRTPTFGRIPFSPGAEEIAKLAIPHLESAERAVVSFGQGCEGEPLLMGEILVRSVERMRSATRRGTINLNSNGSRPDTVERLCRAGLDAIRVSINSARQCTYDPYYLPSGYGFDDVVESLRVVRRHGGHSSINWLVFPGVSDRQTEVDAIIALANEVSLNLIQVRNLNIDPELYLESLGPSWADEAGEALGMRAMLKRLRAELPQVKLGYFNPPREDTALLRLGP